MKLKSRINILYAIQSKYPGGVDNQLLNILRHINKKVFNPIIISSENGRPIKMFKKYGFRTEVLQKDNWKERQKEILLIFKKKRIDLIHNTTLGFIEIAVAAKLAGVPHVWHIYARLNSVYPKVDRARVKRHLHIMHAMSSRIIACSRFAKEQFKALEIGRKVRIIYNGIDLKDLLDKARGGNDIFRRTFSIDQDDFLVGMIGRLDPQKHQMDFIKAASLIKRWQPCFKVKFILVGGETSLKYLNQLQLMNRKYNNPVIIAEHHNQIGEVINSIDLLAMPAIDDALPLVILEAMAFGKPVVGTYSGGIPEIIQHNRTGILIPPAKPAILAKAILKIANNQKLANKMGMIGKRRLIKMFSINATINHIERVYYQALRVPNANKQNK